MIALVASIFALGIGPLIYQTFGPMKRTDFIVSGFILIVITVTLITEVLPHTVENIGYIAIGLALLGFAGPTLIERLFTQSANRTHIITILLGILGLIIHASFDGAALYPGENQNNSDQLSLAIILHRLPVGLTIWWLLKPLIGERLSLLTLLTMAVATAGGYALSMQITAIHTSNATSILQAFISGSLLHVILHKPHEDGCMHTGHTHHHNSNQQTVQQTNSSKFNLPNKWETIGMVLGLSVMFYLHIAL
ncbi:MAG: hypothetical protein ACPGJI_08525 [Kangiellaceae bacterium]